MADFTYLKKYMRSNYGKIVEVGKNNVFHPVDKDEITTAEESIGYAFPSQLREFYEQVGSGNLTTPLNPPEGYDFYSSNEIIPPDVLAHFIKGESFWENQTNYISEDTLELLQPGDIPFFEISDSSAFMFMKALSDNPNAVWYMGAIKIEDSLEQFIYNLYYKGPAYYADNW